MISSQQNIYAAYHAHVYFDETCQAEAASLCLRAGQDLGIRVGHFHTRLVGPHPDWSCQLTFNKDRFDDVMAWLELNRNGLTILIHGVTGDNLTDHTDHAFWLGEPVTLNLDVFTDDVQYTETR